MFDDNGSNIIDDLVSDLKQEAKEKELDVKKEEKRPLLIFNLDSDSEEEEVKPRKSKYKSPKYFIILDDLSNELKTKSLINLFKMHRHFKMKIAASSQYFLDLDPQSRKQMDYCLVFKGEPDDKLKQLHRDFDLSIEFELFKDLYLNATEQKYNFLYIDIREGKFRKNFNKEYDLSDFEN